MARIPTAKVLSPLVTPAELKLLVTNLLQEQFALLSASMVSTSSASASSSAAAAEAGSGSSSGSGEILYTLDNGKYAAFIAPSGAWRMIPEGFVFPRAIDVRNLWNRWHFGMKYLVNETMREIAPLKRLATQSFRNDIPDVNRRKIVFKAAKVMRFLDEAAVELELFPDISSVVITPSSSEDTFNKAFEKLVQHVYGPDALHTQRRYADLHYTTYCEKIGHKPGKKA